MLKGEGTSRSDSKQPQGTETTLTQHCYSDADTVEGLGWRCFSTLCFLNTNYTDTFSVYSCIYHFSRFSFVEFSCLCDACGVTPLFPCHFSSTLILFTITCIDNPTISFDINNYSVFIFTMVTMPFGSARDLMMFAISSATIFYMIFK